MNGKSEYSLDSEARLRSAIDSIAVPDVSRSEFSAEDESAIRASVEYLESGDAHALLRRNPYNPKWSSPWWHFTLLTELGQAERAPRGAVDAFAESIRRTYHDGFFETDAPPGTANWEQLFPCPCQLGTAYRVLAACGHDVDATLPWARNWFLRYQMPDGGLNCNDVAYRATPPASSIVGTIAPLEAMLYAAKNRTPAEDAFLDRGAECLMGRKLVHATNAPGNADEFEDEAGWRELAFPRYYFYDVLRGLRWLVDWSEARGKKIPADALLPAVEFLAHAFPDGNVRIGRRGTDEISTARMPTGDGEFAVSPALRFPALVRFGEPGRVSPVLSTEWARVRRAIRAEP